MRAEKSEGDTNVFAPIGTISKKRKRKQKIIWRIRTIETRAVLKSG